MMRYGTVWNDNFLKLQPFLAIRNLNDFCKACKVFYQTNVSDNKYKKL